MSAAKGMGSQSVDDFEAFYVDEYDGLVRLAYLLVGSAGDPESLVQEAFTRVHPRFSGVQNPRAYTKTTLVNLCRRHQRRAAKEHAFREQGQRVETPITDDAAELLDVIDRLPFRQRAVVVLRYYDDQSEDAIAEVLGCRPGTVKSLAQRALERLRKELS